MTQTQIQIFGLEVQKLVTVLYCVRTAPERLLLTIIDSCKDHEDHLPAVLLLIYTFLVEGSVETAGLSKTSRIHFANATNRHTTILRTE